MHRNTKENNEIVTQTLKYIGLDLKKISSSLLNMENIKYKPVKTYEDNNYKVYKYVDVKDIDVLITPVDRLDDLNNKLKQALPLACYLDSKNKEFSEQHETFIDMLKNADIEKIKQIDNEQKQFSKSLPYEIKYKDNYIWQIYYSDIDEKYFMLYSSNESNCEALLYLIKKKLEKGSTKIYVPISHLEHSNKLLKKTEIADLENYLWFFTKEWPNIYEVFDKNDTESIVVIGKTKVYENIKSLYKITMNNQDEAQETFKLLKALFILQSNDEMEYDFKPVINENGSLDFCYNLKKIAFNNLSEFIRQEVEVKQERIDKLFNENMLDTENLEILNETVSKQKEEFLQKEKQITNYLECKKTFFGKVKYFFKKRKKVKDQKESRVRRQQEEAKKIVKPEKIEAKSLYTIEDLLKVCESLKAEEIKSKNMKMDIKALEFKKENLEKKIKNATLYINEIEKHKKSIFDFWKFANKDELNMLMQGEEQNDQSTNNLKKVFEFEEDIEELGKKVDQKQRYIFNQNETDSFFAIRNDLNTFNLLRKDKILKKDDSQIERTIKKLQQEYLDNIDVIRKKEFDIFGNVVEDKTKIKVLNNNKHREIEKDKFKILNISTNTTLEEYKDIIFNYKKILEDVYFKMTAPYDFSIYKTDNDQISENQFEIFDLNQQEEIDNFIEEKTNLFKLNIKESMPIIFYSNIMYFDNLNKTLPVGMDIETKTLIDLNRFNLKLVSRKDFRINKILNEFENTIQTFQVYEYDLETKEDII